MEKYRRRDIPQKPSPKEEEEQEKEFHKNEIRVTHGKIKTYVGHALSILKVQYITILT